MSQLGVKDPSTSPSRGERFICLRFCQFELLPSGGKVGKGLTKKNAPATISDYECKDIRRFISEPFNTSFTSSCTSLYKQLQVNYKDNTSSCTSFIQEKPELKLQIRKLKLKQIVLPSLSGRDGERLLYLHIPI